MVRSRPTGGGGEYTLRNRIGEPIAELPANTVGPAELPADVPVELPGSSPVQQR